MREVTVECEASWSTSPWSRACVGRHLFWDVLHYRTIGLWLSDCNFFLLSNYRNIEYRIGELTKLLDYRISDQGLNLSDYRISESEKNYRLTTSKGYSGSPPPLDSAASLRPVPLVTRVTQDINRGWKFCQLLPTKGEKKQRHLFLWRNCWLSWGMGG